MSNLRSAGLCVLLALLAPGPRVVDAASASCESLTSLRLPHATVTSAGAVAGGALKIDNAQASLQKSLAGLPAVCRVGVTATPTDDSDIKIEVWLPAANWNGRFQAVGNGGWAGTIPYAAMAAAIERGYAAAGTDTGHSTTGASFALGHPEKLADYAHRSLHEMAVHAKAVVNAYYGSRPQLSMWNGCSTGGNQGLTLASMYPEDFDAIIAGAPPDPRARLHAVRLLAYNIVHRTKGSYVPPEKYAVLHDAVLNACDARDGVKDGVLENPAACRFDPKVVECQSGDAGTCLTPEQVETARALYSEVKHPRTGEVLYPPLLQPGSEMMWGTLAGPTPYVNAVEPYRFLVAKDAKWEPAAFDANTGVAAMDTAAAVLDTVTPDLNPFFTRGGKLLMYHGWNDQQVPASSSLRYFSRVTETVGNSAAGRSIQLYMVPGMTHCRGGDGTDTFDTVAAMEDWIARGTAPARIAASRVKEGKTDRTRPLCPYPQVAAYNGSGSPDQSENFTCKVADTR